METSKYDLIVIGGGPAGYIASIRASQLGFKTACVEKSKALGGTCLNIGCIPSKALLESSEHYHQAKTKFSRHGITTGEVAIDLSQMMKRKDSVVRQLSNGVAGLFRKNKIDWVQGEGSFSGIEGDQKLIQVQTAAGPKSLSAPKVLIATGSEAASLPFLPFDGKRVLSSTEALSLPEIPKHLVVIGAGAIGLELGSVWLRLGAKVTVVEFLDQIAAGADRQLAIELQKALAKQGMEFKLSSKCTGAKKSDSEVVIEAEEMPSGNKFLLSCDYVLVATGRKPYTGGLGLDRIGLSTDAKGKLAVGADFQTKVPGVYAAGDILPGPMLAHKAEEEGVAAVESMAGKHGHVNYDAIPAVIYTWPELASVGASEEQLRKKDIAFKSGMFPFIANGRARAMDETDGTVKVIADAKTDKILGVHIVGPRAGDLVSEAVVAIESGMTADQLARTSHAHPSLCEAVKEAALAVHSRTLNI